MTAQEAMEEVVTFVEDCETEQKIHPELANELAELIIKNAELLIKELEIK